MNAPVEQLEAIARDYHSSVRAAIREIPPVFGQFWPDSAGAEPEEG